MDLEGTGDGLESFRAWGTLAPFEVADIAVA